MSSSLTGARISGTLRIIGPSSGGLSVPTSGSSPEAGSEAVSEEEFPSEEEEDDSSESSVELVLESLLSSLVLLSSSLTLAKLLSD